MTIQQQAEQLKGMYFLKNQYIPNGENIPFHVLGYSFDDKFPISVKTIEYRGLDKKEVTNTYTIESINNIIANLSISKLKPTNLNMLFQQMIRNFAHLVDVKPLTKDEFLNKVKESYSLENAKNNLFYHSIIQCEFDTIRLSNDRNRLLFNQ